MKENKNFISVKLFTKQEDEEKQKKINNLNNINMEKEKKFEIKENSFICQEREAEKQIENEIKGEMHTRIQNNKEMILNRKLYTQSGENQVYITENSQIGNFDVENQDKLKQFNSIFKEHGKNSNSETLEKHKDIFQTQAHFPNVKEKDEDLFSESFLDNFSQFGVDEHPVTAEDNKNSASFYIDQINQNSMIGYPHQLRQCSYPPMNFTPVFPVFYPTGACPVPWTAIESRNSFVLKYVCNYEIQIENDTKFRVTKRLIGNKGLILKKILYDSCIKFGDLTTKIRLRGRGSGYKEGAMLKESEDPMQLCISSLCHESYSRCCCAVEILLKQIYQEYFNYNFQNYKILEASPKEILKHEYVVNRY